MQPHPLFGITVFHWNNKYLIKFELADLEQTYKIRETDIVGEPDIQTLLADAVFMQQVADTFSAMKSNLNRAVGQL